MSTKRFLLAFGLLAICAVGIGAAYYFRTSETKRQFDAIQVGMTRQDVKDILGEAHLGDAAEWPFAVWLRDDVSVHVYFEDDIKNQMLLKDVLRRYSTICLFRPEVDKQGKVMWG